CLPRRDIDDDEALGRVRPDALPNEHGGAVRSNRAPAGVLRGPGIDRRHRTSGIADELHLPIPRRLDDVVRAARPHPPEGLDGRVHRNALSLRQVGDRPHWDTTRAAPVQSITYVASGLATLGPRGKLQSPRRYAAAASGEQYRVRANGVDALPFQVTNSLSNGDRPTRSPPPATPQAASRPGRSQPTGS